MDVPVQWERVSDSKSSDWPFLATSKRIAVGLSHVIRGPQIYRFTFCNPEGRLCGVYIGEAGCFLERHRHYKPKQEHEEFDWKRFKRGRVSLKIQGWQGLVVLQRLVVREFRLSGVVINQGSISSPFVRKLLENFAVCQAESEGVHVLNRGRDQEIKQHNAKFKKSRSLKANAA